MQEVADAANMFITWYIITWAYSSQEVTAAANRFLHIVFNAERAQEITVAANRFITLYITNTSVEKLQDMTVAINSFLHFVYYYMGPLRKLVRFLLQ